MVAARSGRFPLFAEFFADALNQTVSGGPPYLLGVQEPISTGCDADNSGHGRGLSQEGASRWARGNRCANINTVPGDPWSVTWTRVEQILVHYYTQVHLRDASGGLLTPDNRWNPLTHTVPATLVAEAVVPATLVLQNTSTWEWTEGDGVVMGQQWTARGAPPVSQDWQVVLHDLVAPAGQALTVTLPVTAPSSAGEYTLHLDLGVSGPYLARSPRLQGIGYLWFYEDGWPHLTIPVTVIGGVLREKSLRQQARTLLVEAQPGLEALVGESRGEGWVVTAGWIERGERFLAALRLEASPELAAEVQWWRQRLPGWAGKTPQQVWQELLQEPRTW